MTAEERAVEVCMLLSTHPGPRGVFALLKVSGEIAAAIRAAVAEERERLAGEVEMMLGRMGQSALGLKVADFIRAGGSPPASPPAG